MIYIMEFSIRNKTLSVVAKRNSGKSELVKYLIIDAIREKLFNKIFVISSTNCVNHFYNDFIEPTCIFDSYSEDWVEKLITLMSKENDKKNSKDAYHVLLVLDDMCSDVLMHNSPSIRKLFSRGRHACISVIVIAQMLHHISPLMRCNSDYILSGQLNSANIELMSDEFRCPLISKKEFIILYKKLTSNYNFMVINNNTITKNVDDINEYYGSIKAEI